MRSTTIKTNNNIDIIVPNKSFIENNIINWTHNDNTVRLLIPFGVAY
jgi:small-conductance mechanosensitive channel